MEKMKNSKLMIAFIVFVLGITLMSGLQESTKKDLNKPASNQVNQSYKQK